jgi:hypothetical protein
MNWFKKLSIASLAAMSLNASANTLTDLWYNPAESGWGANIVQQDDVAFVTLFVYGPNGEPVWYGAPATHVYAYGADGAPYFSGDLYKTRGSWQGGPFDPNAFTGVKVGTVSLSPLGNGSLKIDYTVNEITVSKVVVRQTWRNTATAGNYVGAFTVLKSVAGNTAVREISAANIALYIDNGIATLRVDDDNQVRCDYQGPYVQAGRLGNFAGGFNCTDGRIGTFRVDELEVTNQGLSAKFRANWTGGSSNGRFGGPRR